MYNTLKKVTITILNQPLIIFDKLLKETEPLADKYQTFIVWILNNKHKINLKYFIFFVI
jgi:hypothetical protein